MSYANYNAYLANRAICCCNSGSGGATGAQGPQGATGAQGPQGATGATGAQGIQGAPRGNTAVVDTVYGNDATASIGGTPYKTVQAAISAVTSGQTVWILPGTYNLASGITIPNGTAIRGLNTQTVTLQMLGVTADTTLITMGENCRLEDVTLKLASSAHHTLKGIVFGGTSTVTSKLRTSVLTVDNSTATAGGTSNVYGVEANGTGSLNSESFSFNCLKGSTINVRSNGGGNKRGILVSNANVVTTRDLNIYVAAPTTPASSTGSYVGVETNDPIGPNVGSVQMRATTVGITTPTGTQPYTASDIMQTTPAVILDPSYLASPGIQVGPGTDLVTKSAGNKGFSTYVYPSIVYYGLKGNITSAAAGGWLWPGTCVASAGVFPDAGTPPPFFRIQQPALLSGISGSLNVAPITGTVTLSAQYTPIGNQTPNLGPAAFTGSIAGTALTITALASGTVQIGQLLTGSGVSNRTYIVAGSGTSWTVSNSQTVGSTAMTSACYYAGATFSGNITSNTTLTVTSAIVGTIQIGQFLSAVSGATSGASGVFNGTYIVSGSGTSWVVNQSHNVSTIAMKSYAIIPTAFELTFTTTTSTLNYYNSSTRLNTGDKLLLYSNYTGTTNAHDITCQLDLF